MLKFIKEQLKNILIIALALAIIFWGYLEYQRYKKSHFDIVPVLEATAVQVTPPVPQNYTLTKSYIGMVEAINSVNVVPYITGYITFINVEGDQTVAKGDILLVIQQDTYKAALDSAYADYLSARASKNYALNQYKRMLNAGEQAISALELENALTSYQTAAAGLKQAEANYFSAQTNYDYTILKAPFSGILGNVTPSVGDYISQESSNLMKIVQYDPIRVVFSLTDKEYLTELQSDGLFVHDKIKLVLANNQPYPYDGQIKYTTNEVDKTTNTVAIYAEFPNPEKKLMPNAYVKVLLEREYSNVILINKSLLVQQKNGDCIYVVNAENELILTPIKILADTETQYILENTFTSGEQIVSESVDKRLLGKKVQIITPNRLEK